MQILEQLAPLQLAKEHLPSDIIDILERLGKVDNIPFNQFYYIAENCVDRYYSKVIQTFVFIIKREFTNRQTLLINTAHSLKFLEEYTDRQAQIWKVLHKYQNLPDNVEDLHFHFNSFKSSIETASQGGNVLQHAKHPDISWYTTDIFLHLMFPHQQHLQ